MTGTAQSFYLCNMWLKEPEIKADGRVNLLQQMLVV
jgi:hypothetical protein